MTRNEMLREITQKELELAEKNQKLIDLKKLYAEKFAKYKPGDIVICISGIIYQIRHCGYGKSPFSKSLIHYDCYVLKKNLKRNKKYFALQKVYEDNISKKIGYEPKDIEYE